MCENGDCIDLAAILDIQKELQRALKDYYTEYVFSSHIIANVPILKLYNPKPAVLMCKRRPF